MTPAEIEVLSNIIQAAENTNAVIKTHNQMFEMIAAQLEEIRGRLSFIEAMMLGADNDST